ncbi:MAG: hypothetical protein KKA16_14160 [Alphaproteobacteria bacterium]|nr:hypothetical protein [Alphaproteobacteria bacterium]
MAQTAAQSARPAALEELAACRIVAVDAERLACFDRVVAAFDQAEQAGEVMVVERRQVTEARRALFGFSLEALPLFQRGAEPDRIDEIETTLARASAGANGKWLFVLADDSVWVQTDSNSLVRPPRPGSEISIRQAAMGSYLLSVNGARSVRVRRQQ